MGKKIRILGWDGADPDLAAAWMADGLLPNLQRLTAGGGYCGPLGGVTPPVTFPAWTTCVTGVTPGRHGIIDFTVIPPGTRRLHFVTGADRRAPAVWETLSAAGARCAVLGVPATWPAAPLNGVMIAGFDSPLGGGITPSHVYPETLLPLARHWRYADTDEHFTGRPGWHHRFAEHLLARLEDKLAVALQILDMEPWDFFMCVLGEADAASHHFWRFMDARSPRYCRDDSLATVILRAYQRLDAFLGEVMRRSDGDTVIMVVSDHGFTGAGIHQASLNRYLEECGWLSRRRHPAAGVKQMLLRAVPATSRARLARQFPRLFGGLEARARMGGIDWSRTRAWSEELSYFPSARLNLAGRDPDGIVPPEKYRETVMELAALLEAWEPVRRAVPRWECFDMPGQEFAPDLIIEPAAVNGYPWGFCRRQAGPSTRILDQDSYAGGREQGFNGVHRNPAFFAANVSCGAAAPSLTDITPTVLGLFGLPAEGLDGSDLLAAGKKSFPSRSNKGLFPESAKVHRRLTPREEAELEDRLRRMGYLD